MLETPEERAELLKAGISGKRIEELYITHNNFKKVRTSRFFELVEIDTQKFNVMQTANEYVTVLV